MRTAPQPAWPLPVMAAVQAVFGSVFLPSLKEPGGSWDLHYALLGTPFTLVGAVVLCFAVRNCVRLWRVEAWEASWKLVASLGVSTTFSLLVAAGPLTVGQWRWTTPIEGLLGLYFLVVSAREVRRRLALRAQAGADQELEHAES